MKDLKLATTASVTSTYAGEFAGKYIMAALLASDTLANNLITIKPNIAYKQVVKHLATSSLLQAEACDFTATGAVTLTERILEPARLMVNLQLCKNDFVQDWESAAMGYGQFKTLPKNFSDFLIGNISASIGASIETQIWATTATYDGFTGFTGLFQADATVNDVSGTTVTAANVQAELAKVVVKAATLKFETEPVIYVGKDIYANYQISLGGFGASGLGANGFKGEGPNQTFNDLYFAGYKIVKTPGMPASEMVLAEPENLWFGTGIMQDFNSVKVIDLADTDGSENVRFVSRFSAGVQYGVGAQIVYYWIY